MKAILRKDNYVDVIEEIPMALQIKGESKLITMLS